VHAGSTATKVISQLRTICVNNCRDDVRRNGELLIQNFFTQINLNFIGQQNTTSKFQNASKSREKV